MSAGGAGAEGAAMGGRTVIGLLKELHAGTMKGAALSPSDRRRVVEQLWADGSSVPETAEVLGLHERTIARDRKQIREDNALKVHEGFVPEMVGTFSRQAEASVARLRRIARDRDTPAAVKVEAERTCWQVHREFIESMQSLGYLPRAAHELRALLSVDHGPQYEELQREMLRLESVVDPEFAPQAAKVRETIAKLAPPPGDGTLPVQTPDEPEDPS